MYVCKFHDVATFPEWLKHFLHSGSTAMCTSNGSLVDWLDIVTYVARDRPIMLLFLPIIRPEPNMPV